MNAGKTFALALGGGGARAFAQIAILEAIDEMGVRPVAISGSSMGAAIGAAYAAGMSGKELRRYALSMAQDRGSLIGRALSARATTLAQVFSAGFGNPFVLDAQKLCAVFMPDRIPQTFAELSIPLSVVAVDLYGREEILLSEGNLRGAIAASLAVPGLMQPVTIGQSLLIDGAATNPVPFDILRGKADIVIAVDSSGGPNELRGVPDPWESVVMTLQLIGHMMMQSRLREGAPDLMIRPNVGAFRMLDFVAANAIMRSADAMKPEVRERLGALLAT